MILTPAQAAAGAKILGVSIMTGLKDDVIGAAKDNRTLAQFCYAKSLLLLLELEAYVAFVAHEVDYQNGHIIPRSGNKLPLEPLIQALKECFFLVDYARPMLGKDFSQSLRSAANLAVEYRFKIGTSLEKKAKTNQSGSLKYGDFPVEVQDKALEYIEEMRRRLRHSFVQTEPLLVSLIFWVRGKFMKNWKKKI